MALHSMMRDNLADYVAPVNFSPRPLLFCVGKTPPAARTSTFGNTAELVRPWLSPANVVPVTNPLERSSSLVPVWKRTVGRSVIAWRSRRVCLVASRSVMVAGREGTTHVSLTLCLLNSDDDVAAGLTTWARPHRSLGPNVVFFSTPPYHGTLTRWHAHPASWLHRLPDNVSYEEGALCEPLAVALAGIERAGIALGDPIVIT